MILSLLKIIFDTHIYAMIRQAAKTKMPRVYSLGGEIPWEMIYFHFCAFLLQSEKNQKQISLKQTNILGPTLEGLKSCFFCLLLIPFFLP